MHDVGVLYTFVGLAIVCEHEFKDSLVEICRQLNLSEDIAGATFMAAGTSSPELFTALVAVWSPKDDIGVSTIVGSAIFNILIIIGSSVVVSGMCGAHQ
jgi:Ca2+/Na+ antiporter